MRLENELWATGRLPWPLGRNGGADTDTMGRAVVGSSGWLGCAAKLFLLTELGKVCLVREVMTRKTSKTIKLQLEVPLVFPSSFLFFILSLNFINCLFIANWWSCSYFWLFKLLIAFLLLLVFLLV